MKRRLLIISIVALLPWLCRADEHKLTPTKYDWAVLARPIVNGSDTNYDKLYAIFRWICNNISYDGSGVVFDADGCYESRRGVCAAYAELFCRLANGAGITTEYISGIAKDPYGNIDPEGHAWVFAYINPDEGEGILIDPTWGAGTYEHGVFTRARDDMWFDVDPYWMIFSHYPEKEKYQLIGKPISRKQFERIKRVDPVMTQAGFDGRKVLDLALNGQSDNIPLVYSAVMRDFGVEGASLPPTRHLRVGEPQKVAFKVGCKPFTAKVLGSGLVKKDHGEWTQRDSTIVGTFVPACEGEINIGLNDGTDNYYTYIASYVVDAPTDADIERLEAAYPHLSPEWARFGNFRPDFMKALGMDFGQTLAAIKSGGVTSLPEYYKANKVRLVDVPLNGVLHVGQTYTFTFVPLEVGKWALLNSRGDDIDWYYDITKEGNAYTMTVTPQKTGELKLSMQHGGEGLFYATIVYKVMR